MAITTQHKIYLGVLALAGLGLLLDRTVLSPHAAQATDEDDVALSEAEEAFAEPPSLNITRTRSVASHLTQVAARMNAHPADVKDVFTAAWIAPATTDAPSPGLAAPAADDSQTIFQHRLTAVMGSSSASARYAVVDGTPLRLGQKVGDWTLIDIGHRNATFERQGQSVTINVDGDKHPSATPQIQAPS